MATDVGSLYKLYRTSRKNPSRIPYQTLPESHVPDPVTAKDDAFHFNQFENSPHAFWYTEWWYFNFLDERANVAGMATIAVFNPKSIDGLGVGSLTVAAFEIGGPTPSPIIEYFDISEFSPSPDNANVKLADNSVTVESGSVYRLSVATKNGAVKMDLEFTQADEPRMLAHDVHGTGWDISSWLSYMPSAVVSGTLHRAGKSIEIKNAKGYHDHDWGMWQEYKRTWSWAQFSSLDKQISFDFGFHAAFQVSVAYLRIGDIRLTLPQDKFTVTQENYKSWKWFWKYPTFMSFVGIDSTGEYKLVLNWHVLDTATLWKYPVIVFEQTAHYNGALLKLDGDVWKEEHVIRETGFCEFTATWLKFKGTG